MNVKDMCSLIDGKIKDIDGKNHEADTTRLNESVEDLLDKVIAKDTSEGTGCDNMSACII